MLSRPGTRQRLSLCRVPGYLHTGNNGRWHCLRASLPCAMVNAHSKEPRFYLFFIYYVYGTPSITSILYIYHNKHFMYPKKHRRHLILSRNAQMQINSCFVHRQPQVQVKSIQVHTSSYKSSPYKFKCKASIHVPRNEVHTTHGADGGGGGDGGCCGHISGGGHVGVGDQPCCGGDGCC